jgi:hypothetical protein
LRPIRFGVSLRHMRESSVTLCSDIRETHRHIVVMHARYAPDTFRERVRAF